MSSSLRTQTYVNADAPRVLIYENYVMYDRLMKHDRFNRDSCTCEFRDLRDEIQYYRNNYRHFLVLKFSRITNEIVLFDHVRCFLYNIENPIHTHEVDLMETWNEYHERNMWYLRVQKSLRNSYCLNTINGYFCDNKHNNFNGYCDTCQENVVEFDDIDVDRLLTYNEFISLPEFSDYPDNPFFDELDRYDDTDVSDNDSCDTTDEIHGEDTDDNN
jgi:hypothetical protein